MSIFNCCILYANSADLGGILDKEIEDEDIQHHNFMRLVHDTFSLSDTFDCTYFYYGTDKKSHFSKLFI